MLQNHLNRTKNPNKRHGIHFIGIVRRIKRKKRAKVIIIVKRCELIVK